MEKYLTGKVEDYIDNIHTVAKDNPMMSESQLLALKDSIESIGQSDPIKVWRGKVVDGRNRLKALKELGIDTVLLINLPHKAGKEYLQSVADGSEARRHQTPTQLAVKAFRISKKTGQSLKKCAVIAGVSESSVNIVSAINKIRPDILDILQGGNLYKLSNGYATDSLQSIRKDLKSISEASSVTKEDIENMIKHAQDVTPEDETINALVVKLKQFINIAGLTDEEIALLPKAVITAVLDIIPDEIFKLSDDE